MNNLCWIIWTNSIPPLNSFYPFICMNHCFVEVTKIECKNTISNSLYCMSRKILKHMCQSPREIIWHIYWLTIRHLFHNIDLTVSHLFHCYHKYSTYYFIWMFFQNFHRFNEEKKKQYSLCIKHLQQSWDPIKILPKLQTYYQSNQGQDLKAFVEEEI